MWIMTAVFAVPAVVLASGRTALQLRLNAGGFARPAMSRGLALLSRSRPGRMLGCAIA